MQSIDINGPEIGGDNFPFPLCIIRVADQMVVTANKAGLKLFGYSIEDLMNRSLWDIVAQVDWDLIVREASRSRPGAEQVDIPSSGLLTFRHADGSEFISWFRVRDITDDDGVTRYRAALLLEDSMATEDESINQAMVTLLNQNYLSRIAGNAAHEVNNSLSVLEDFVNRLSSTSQVEHEVVNRALKRLKDVGSQLSLVGEKGQIEAGSITPVAPSISPSQQEGTVLVVEDEPDLSDVIVSLLKSAGYLVFSAASIGEALNCFEKGAIDCALLDVQLDGELGTDLAQTITCTSPSTQVIMMSGFSRHIEKLRVEGKYQFLRKPFPMFELLEMIKKAVTRD